MTTDLTRFNHSPFSQSLGVWFYIREGMIYSMHRGAEEKVGPASDPDRCESYLWDLHEKNPTSLPVRHNQSFLPFLVGPRRERA
jgi:hypothetical protein